MRPHTSAKERGRSRHLARARYEGGKSAAEIAQIFADEVQRIITEGRIPWNVALDGLAIVQGDLEDSLAAESLSFAVNFQPCYDNHRARMEG